MHKSMSQLTQHEIPVLLQVNDSLTKVATSLQIMKKKKQILE